MKQKILLTVFCIAALACTGCQKCTTCNYDIHYVLYDSEGLVIEEGDETQGSAVDFCGKNGEVDDYEATYDQGVDEIVSGYESLGYVVTINEGGCQRN